MIYVGSQIVVFIIMAVVLGFAFGWAMRSRRGAKRRRRRRLL